MRTSKTDYVTLDYYTPKYNNRKACGNGFLLLLNLKIKMSKKAELNYQDIQLKELEKKTGISTNTLGNYLAGHNSAPSVDNAVKIAAAPGVSVEYLVTGRCGGAFADSL